MPQCLGWSRLLAGWGLIAITAGLSGCQWAVLSPAGPIAEGNRIILLDSLAIMLAIVVPTLCALLVVCIWYREGNARARYRPEFSYSGRLELLVWSIPALVVFFLGGMAWISAHRLDPAQPIPSSAPPLELEVIALDWKWLFIYPQQGIASVNRLVVPVGVPLHLQITSASVLNVFFVPQLGSEIYGMYGMSSRLNLRADRAGTYFGLSAHFSGNGFADMAFDVLALPADQFSAWMAQTHVHGPSLDEPAYRGLLRQTARVAPYTYRDVMPGLFQAVTAQRLPPGVGPQLPDGASESVQAVH
jgi:cytochrome o ubiquinol oxidase subunit 2